MYFHVHRIPRTDMDRESGMQKWCLPEYESKSLMQWKVLAGECSDLQNLYFDTGEDITFT